MSQELSHTRPRGQGRISGVEGYVYLFPHVGQGWNDPVHVLETMRLIDQDRLGERHVGHGLGERFGHEAGDLSITMHEGALPG